MEGPLREIVDRYSGSDVMLESDQEVPSSELYDIVAVESEETRIRLKPEVDLQQLYLFLGELPVAIQSVRPFRTPLSEIFITEVERHS